MMPDAPETIGRRTRLRPSEAKQKRVHKQYPTDSLRIESERTNQLPRRQGYRDRDWQLLDPQVGHRINSMSAMTGKDQRGSEAELRENGVSA